MARPLSLAGLHRRGQQPRPDGLEGRGRQHGTVEHHRRDQRRARTSRRAPWPLYREHGLNARIAFNAMSGYGGWPRQEQDIANEFGFLGDDMFRYLGPGEDMMPDDPDYPTFTRAGSQQAAQRRDARRRPRSAARRLRGGQHGLPGVEAQVADRAPQQQRAERCAARPRQRPRRRLGADVLGSPQRSARSALQDGHGKRRAHVPRHRRDQRRAVGSVPNAVVRDHRSDHAARRHGGPH